jgi:perosamine synthetase
MSVEFKIRVAEPVLDGNESKYVLNCLEENWISSKGKYIDTFERLLAEYCGTRHAIVTNNGTTSLHLALAAMGVAEGDEVIMPTLSYVATANAAVYCNATPVFVDCEPEYFSMDPEKIEKAITPRTKAIMTVPLYGHPVDMDPIQRVAQEHGLAVLEDSAESLGAEYKGRRIGSLALCSSFSFFGNKTITTGEGGAITTDNDELAMRMRYLRGQAVDPSKNYWHKEIGFNYRMTNLAAAIGVAQAERLPIHVERRRQVAKWYKEALWSHQSYLQLPKQADWAKHSYWMYTVLIREANLQFRDQMIHELANLGVETRPVFYPIHTMPSHFRNQRYPVSERCSYSGLNLPTHGRMTKADVEFVADSMSKAYAIASQKSQLRRAA